MSYTWIAFYEQLADKLVAWRDRQPELLALLAELKAQGLPMVSLKDKVGKRSLPLDEIDPFTIFASFNRNVRTDNRQSILARMKEYFGVATAVPVDFDGIPVADNMQSWFFPYKKDRATDDVGSLWTLFAQAVHAGHRGIDAATFDRCLNIKSVSRGKLTMGLFWIRPREFLPLDKRTRSHLAQHGVAVPTSLGWSRYGALIEAVQETFGSDYPAISHAAYLGEEPASAERRYWAGGHQFGDESQLRRFKDTRRWEIGWSKDATTKGARGAWGRIGSISRGDLFAIKGYGGRNHLRIHLVGRVVSVDAENGRLSFELVDQPLFRGKAPGPPGDGTWFETLVEVTNRNALAAIFGGGTSRIPKSAPEIPLNLILFGPPGTGKTWTVLREIRPLFELDDGASLELGPDVAGLTWFQVVALALHDLGPSGVPEIQEHPLVLAKYAERGVRAKLGPVLWGTLQGHSVEDSQTVKYARRHGLLLFDRMEDGRWHLPHGLPEELLTLLPDRGGVEPLAEEASNLFFVTFHPSFTYEDFVEGLRPESDEEDDTVVRYPMRAGIFKQACERAVQLAGFSAGLDAFCRLRQEERRSLLADAPPVAVFIDEISRGNVARILGELITLLEPDKRLGGDNEIIVALPGSRRLFGVPSNLWVVGTMNTADRSVVALDTALRRRFSFRECPPQPALLYGVEVDGIDLGEMLDAINSRVERLRDMDHLIGHAFFMAMKEDPDQRTLHRLRGIFKESIIPLLQEYFYDDLGRIGLVLGPKFVQCSASGADVFAKGFAHDQRDDLADRSTWRLSDIDSLDAEAFRSIYE